MKKILSLIISLVLISTVLLSCSPKATKENIKNTETSISNSEESEDVKEEGKTEASISTTDAKLNPTGTVTVYSPHPTEAIDLGVKAFEAKYAIKVNVVAAGTGELLARVKSESANPLGDVLWGGGAESLQAFSEFFEKYVPTEMEAIDPQYVDKNNMWTGESPLPMVIMYNTNLVQEDMAPKGWGDIIKPEFKGKIAMADPAKSGSSYTIMLTMIQAFGKEDNKGWDFIREFYANLDGKLLGSSGAVYKGVNDGEYSVGLTLEKEAIKYVNAGGPVKIVYPSEGTSAVPDGVAIIKGAKNMDNAKLFLDYVTSAECQTLMAEELSRRPVRTDVANPAELPDMAEIKLIDYDFEWAASEKEAILGKWKDIVIGK